MSADDHMTPAVRAARLLDRGPVSVPIGSPSQRMRARLRAWMLLLARPQARYQHEVDEAIVSAVKQAETMLARQGEQTEYLEDLVRELIATAESLRRAMADDDASVATELKALPYTAGHPFETMQSPVGEVLGFPPGTLRRQEGASDYVSFEDLFRGPADRVAESQRPYLALVGDGAPVLDVGCGRGEFLALLAQEGVPARGVDSDPGMVERCRALGMDVVQADVNEYLAELGDGSLGTVFSAQVVEHLPHPELHRLLALVTPQAAAGRSVHRRDGQSPSCRLIEDVLG